MKLTLTEDTPEIKSLYLREEEYVSYLAAVEFAIASAYLENRKLKDGEVVKILKTLKRDHSGSDPLAKDILQNLAEATAEAPISRHELGFVFDYIVWAIDNRSWLPDSQAYVKWLAYAMGEMTPAEEHRYVKHIETFAQKHGVPQDKIDAMLLRKEGKTTEEEDDASRKESEFFAMGQKEKIAFLSEQQTVDLDLIVHFLNELREDGDWEVINEFYAYFLQHHPDFVPIYLVMYDMHKDKNYILAKTYLERGLQQLEEIPDVPEEIRVGMRNDIKKELEKDKTTSR